MATVSEDDVRFLLDRILRLEARVRTLQKWSGHATSVDKDLPGLVESMRDDLLLDEDTPPGIVALLRTPRE